MSRIVQFALAQVGKPYVFGRSGPSSYDCSGLTKRAVAQIGLDWYHGATTQWLRGKQTTAPPEQYSYFGETGAIDKLPMDKVAFLFAQDKTTGKMAHVGIYAGNGWVVQAGGYGGRGVHYNKLDRRRWTHYAILNQYWTDRDGDEEMDSTVLKRGAVGPQVHSEGRKDCGQQPARLEDQVEPVKGPLGLIAAAGLGHWASTCLTL